MILLGSCRILRLNNSCQVCSVLSGTYVSEPYSGGGGVMRWRCGGGSSEGVVVLVWGRDEVEVVVW